MAWVGMSAYSWGGTGSAPYLNNILAGPQQYDLAVRTWGLSAAEVQHLFHAAV